MLLGPGPRRAGALLPTDRQTDRAPSLVATAARPPPPPRRAAPSRARPHHAVRAAAAQGEQPLQAHPEML